MKYPIFKIMTALLPLMLMGCSQSESDALFTNCISIGMKEQMVGWEESDRPSVKKGVEQGCKVIIKECKENPDGEICKAFKLKYGVELK